LPFAGTDPSFRTAKLGLAPPPSTVWTEPSTGAGRHPDYFEMTRTISSTLLE